MLLDFAEREGIDVMILGHRENKTVAQAMLPGTKKLTSTAANFKARAKCPALVIRPAVSPAASSTRPCSACLHQLLVMHVEGSLGHRCKPAAGSCTALSFCSMASSSTIMTAVRARWPEKSAQK